MLNNKQDNPSPCYKSPWFLIVLDKLFWILILHATFLSNKSASVLHRSSYSDSVCPLLDTGISQFFRPTPILSFWYQFLPVICFTSSIYRKGGPPILHLVYLGRHSMILDAHHPLFALQCGQCGQATATPVQRFFLWCLYLYLLFISLFLILSLSNTPSVALSISVCIIRRLFALIRVKATVSSPYVNTGGTQASI